MSIITPLASPPARASAPASYVTDMDAWLAALPTMVAEFNALNANDFFSVLGTVSQSGGVPTGALFEYGSNANGEYLRIADGTQICWGKASITDVTTAAGSGFKLATNVPWTYPAVFASGTGEDVATTASVNNGGFWVHTYVDTSVTRALIQAKAFGSTAGTFDVTVLAVGRWFV